MNDKEFNLLDEQWIRVIDDRCEIHEVSLIELFKNAHIYKDLCGELPTQDFAMLRLLLAVLHTVFSRYSPSGEGSPLNDSDNALDRWKELWDSGKFPDSVITDYLESQRENFYLFHPVRPFYQVERAKIGTEYTAAKLNGSLSESSNKIRLFTSVSGKAKEELSFSEAARWLIYVNAYDDTSAKPSGEARKSGEKLPSPGAGWLGKLGLVCVLGENLFETLMLNLILVNENGEIYKSEKPIWEREIIPAGERVQIPFPDNLSELYTLQSRRLYMKRDNQSVTGYYLLGGDFFDKENAFIEPMTFWKNPDKKKPDIYSPRRHNSSKQFWRDFSSLVQSGNGRRPGITSWIDRLKEADFIENRFLEFKIASVQYGDKDFFVNNVFSDSLQMHAALISGMNTPWQGAVMGCIAFCDEISNCVWHFARDINLAAGGDNETTSVNFAVRAKADFYTRVDAPFRKWLCALDPETDDRYEREKAWRQECVQIARNFGNELISQIDSAAIFGRKKDNTSDTKQSFSAARSMNIFSAQLNKKGR